MAEFIIGAPLKGPARRYPWLRRLLWRIDFVFVWLLLKGFRLLPVDLASRLGARVGGWVGPRLAGKHRLVKDNLAIAFPALDAGAREQLARDCWRQGGRILAEYPHLDRFAREAHRLAIDVTGANPADLQPCIIACAHLSSWEVVGSALTRLGIANATLYSPPSNPYLDRMLLRSRAVLNCELVPRDNSARALLKALRGGRSVGVVVDRRVDDGEDIDFFGHAKASSMMPAKLALKQGCALVPARVRRLEDARYQVSFHTPITPRDPAADEREQARDMMQQLHDLFAEWIREEPADWLCTKRLWPRGTAPEAPSLSGSKDAS
ncbi:MAG: lysophospholipid acyltransferase family protein [Pseudohaliea sp.]